MLKAWMFLPMLAACHSQPQAASTSRVPLRGSTCMVEGATYRVQMQVDAKDTCGQMGSDYTFVNHNAPEPGMSCDSDQVDGCRYTFTNCYRQPNSITISGETSFVSDGSYGTSNETIVMPSQHCTGVYYLTFNRIKSNE